MSLKILVTGTEKRRLTLEMTELLSSAERIVLHTARCGCAEWLNENGIPFESLDELYETVEDFDEHALMAAEKVLTMKGDVVYCVMNERDESLKAILKQNCDVQIIGPEAARAVGPVTVLSALDMEETDISPELSVLVTEIDTRVSAGEVKLRLMDIYGDEAMAYITKPDGKGAWMPLENLDRLKDYDHRCSCLVNPTGAHSGFSSLLRCANMNFYENVNNDEKSIAKDLAVVIRCISAGIACGEFTAQDIMDTAMEELKNE